LGNGRRSEATHGIQYNVIIEGIVGIADIITAAITQFFLIWTVPYRFRVAFLIALSVLVVYTGRGIQ
jgi:hypothetical protein